MAAPHQHLNPPADYYDPDDADPTGYYERQAKHRDEMLPYLAACIIGMVAIVVVVALKQMIAAY